jgi:hypothetical protein
METAPAEAGSERDAGGALGGAAVSGRRDGYGRCRGCGGPFSDDSDHTETCRFRREWRPLLNGEYPPPGPTRTGKMVAKDGVMVCPIYVYAEVNP